jgi:hypothetical protein
MGKRSQVLDRSLSTLDCIVRSGQAVAAFPINCVGIDDKLASWESSGMISKNTGALGSSILRIFGLYLLDWV